MRRARARPVCRRCPRSATQRPRTRPARRAHRRRPRQARVADGAKRELRSGLLPRTIPPPSESSTPPCSSNRSVCARKAMQSRAPHAVLRTHGPRTSLSCRCRDPQRPSLGLGVVPGAGTPCHCPSAGCSTAASGLRPRASGWMLRCARSGSTRTAQDARVRRVAVDARCGDERSLRVVRVEHADVSSVRTAVALRMTTTKHGISLNNPAQDPHPGATPCQPRVRCAELVGPSEAKVAKSVPAAPHLVRSRRVADRDLGARTRPKATAWRRACRAEQGPCPAERDACRRTKAGRHGGAGTSKPSSPARHAAETCAGLVSPGPSEISCAGVGGARLLRQEFVRPQRTKVEDRYPLLSTSHLIPHRRLS